MAKYLILDAGHSAKTGGKRNTIANPKFFEYEFNNDIAHKLKARAEAHGITVHLTNTTPNGADIALTSRANSANAKYKEWKCSAKDCLFVSIHANAAGSGAAWANARGCETYHANNASQTGKDAALTVNTELYNTLKSVDSGFKNRGRKASNFTVIYKTACPAILVEVGFYDNKEDLNLLQKYRSTIVEGLMKGICKHLGVTYKAVATGAKPVASPINKISNKITDSAKNGIKDIASLKGSFVVKIITDSLNIRKGPGTNYDKVGEVLKGQAFTIVEVKGSWGRLKSGAGWISLNPKYIQKK